MTAGSGVVHGEMFPLINESGPNKNRFFQIWLNLPARDKMTDPKFAMHWAEDVIKFSDPSGAMVTVFAGTFEDQIALPPCPASWAADSEHDVAIWHITLPPGSAIDLPVSFKKNCNR